MHRIVLLVAVLSLICGAAEGEEQQPLSVDEAAGQVFTAVEAGNAKRLAQLATTKEPDRWLVAEQLCVLGRADAAARFAAAGARADAEALAKYVAAFKPASDDATARAAVRKADAALAAQDGAALVAALAGLKASTDGMLGLRVLRLQAVLAAGRGKTDEVTELVDRGAEAAEALGWQRHAAETWEIAASHFQSGSGRRDPNQAVAYYTKSAAAWARIARPVKRLRMLLNTGQGHFQAGRAKQALEVFESVEAEGRRLDARDVVRLAAHNRSLWLQTQGRLDEAREAAETVLKLAEEAGDDGAVVRSLLGLARLASTQSRHEDAGALTKQARQRAEKAGLADLAATASLSEGIYHYNASRYREAQPLLENALAWARSKGDVRMAFYALGALGALHGTLGNRSRSLSMKEDAVALAKRSGSVQVEAQALLSLTRDLIHVGRYEQAAGPLDRALAIAEQIGDVASATDALMMLAVVASQRKEVAAVAELVARARKFPPSAATKPTLVTLLLAASQAASASRDFEKARAHVADAAAIIDEGKLHESYRIGVYREYGNIASDENDDAARREWFEKMLAVAREHGTAGDLEAALGPVADARLRTGDAAGALAAASEVVELLKQYHSGHSDVGAAAIRERRTLAYEAGARAAAKLEDLEAYHRFVEEGRAGALLQGLGGREAVEALTLPEGLRSALLAARRAESSAARRAVRSRSLKAYRAVAAAREALRKLIERAQRDARRSAELAYPEIATRAAVQAALADGEVLVQYSLFRHVAAAEVITQGATRVVDLGASAPIESAVAELLADGGKNITAERTARLRALLAAPLGLPATVKRVLISPAAELAYVPYGLLMPERAVAFVPSGTTLLVLQAARHEKPTQRVLALGNPSYGGRRGLAQLPATAAEAQAVGDEVLLGDDATEARLRATLERTARWRAVHFACHGLIDPAKPLFSSLAVTAAPGEDGLLTAHEILDLRIEADAVVLSACETARGRTYRAEGVLGLTRAFLYAGTPRVICSLWKVDDEATRTLMTRFYALWNPKDGSKGIAAIEALKQAQAFVRDFERESIDREASRKARRTVTKKTRPWKDPRYWAAWVLWGLPD